MNVLFAGDLSFDWLTRPSKLELVRALLKPASVPRPVLQRLESAAGLRFPANLIARSRVQAVAERIARSLHDLTGSVDHFCVNLECPLSASGAPLAEKRFTMRASPLYALALKRLGISVACLANNHILDFGPAGLADTVEALDLAGIACAGLRHGAQARPTPTVISSGRERIAILNCVDPGIIDPRPELYFDHDPCPSPLAPAPILESVADHAAAMPVVVVLHWGEEWSYLESQAQRKFTHELVDAGASAVISHHSHLAGVFEEYRGRPISYGLGNLYLQLPPFSTRRAAFRYMIRLKFEGGECLQHDVLPVVPDKDGFPASTDSFVLESLSGEYLPAPLPRTSRPQFDSCQALANGTVGLVRNGMQHSAAWSERYLNHRDVIEGKVPIGPGWRFDGHPWTGFAQHRELMGGEFLMTNLAHMYGEGVLSCRFNPGRSFSRLFVIAGQPEWFHSRPGFICPRLTVCVGERSVFEFGPELVKSDWTVQELRLEFTGETRDSLTVKVQGEKDKYGYLNWRLIGF